MTEPDHRGHTYVDLTSSEYAGRFASSQARTYRKTTKVKAWQLTQDTPLATVLADGTRETDRMAPAEHWVVENPGGEQYAVEPEKFEALYDATSEPGVFQAKGRIRAIENPTGGPVWINAPWGEPQYGSADCRFACSVLADGSLDLAKPYIIGRAELKQTYAEEVSPDRFASAGQAPAHLAASTRGLDNKSGAQQTENNAAARHGEAPRRPPATTNTPRDPRALG
ncbi:hypothetical protein FB561_4197 [Kribbella amoyensis]|uniref:Uncharacterized protein n=1 Tax=Kribbella amoyensis TaxID=996641 RepID=A0A561BVW5_9ACTN|nr:hypothetical protein [Kribbella amoyensis]TWD83044.1 hypothetical protein FB561_4197 [Kribbella amoyensis]